MIRRRMGCGLALETYFDSFDSTLKDNESYDASTDPFAKERRHQIKYHSSGQFKNMYTIDGVPFGYVCYLSLSGKIKSAVFDPKTTTIVLEEVIENASNDYISNEYSALMSIISSVFRHRNGKVFILGNFLNEESKQAPILRGFGIDVDKQDLKQDTIYTFGGNGKAKIVFYWGTASYENEDEVPTVLKVDKNKVALTGEFEVDYDLFSQKYDYPDVNFITDSIDNFVIFDGEDCYYAVLNDDFQCFDWVKSDFDIHEMGEHGDLEKYNKMIKYKDIYIKEFENQKFENPVREYIKELNKVMPYKLYTPLYDNEYRYGANITYFAAKLKELFSGYGMRWCNSRIKFLCQNRIFKQGVN